jgi:hypothetical protein
LGDPQERLYLVICAWTVAFGALVSIPLPLAYLTCRIDRSDYAVGGLLMLCVTIMVVLRVLRLFHPSHEEGAELRHQEHEEPAPLGADTTSLSDVAATEELPADAEETSESENDTDTQAVPNETDRKDPL